MSRISCAQLRPFRHVTPEASQSIGLCRWIAIGDESKKPTGSVSVRLLAERTALEAFCRMVPRRRCCRVRPRASPKLRHVDLDQLRPAVNWLPLRIDNFPANVDGNAR